MGGTKRAVYKGRPRPKLFNAELAAPDSAAPGMRPAFLCMQTPVHSCLLCGRSCNCGTSEHSSTQSGAVLKLVFVYLERTSRS